MLNKKEWAHLMRYIREVPGTVYEEQLDDVLKKVCTETKHSGNISVDLLNQGFKEDPLYARYLKKDALTGGIYTIPGQRKNLDFFIRDYFDSHKDECGGPYIYNRYLYADAFDENASDLKKLDFGSKAVIDSMVGNVLKVTDGILDIDFSDICDSFAIENFSIANITEYLNDTVNSIGYINANNTVFVGDAFFCFDDLYASPCIGTGAFFNGATFSGNMTMQNVAFDFTHGTVRATNSPGSNRLDFRNARFFGDVSFKDMCFSSNQSDSEVSFEDARIKNASSNKIEFINVDFGQTRLNFFQLIVGDFIDSCESACSCDGTFSNEISFKNVTVSDDSSINFKDAEIHNCIVTFKNIPSMPITNLCFAPITVDSGKNDNPPESFSPDNRLIIENCELRQTVSISNISELSFKNTKNYSKIISDTSWGRFDSFDKSIYHVKSKGLFGATRLGGINIYNNLLLSVYNYCRTVNNRDALTEINFHKAKDLLMLKENFASLGEYDDEDDAFILYMEYKPCSISVRKNDKKNLRKKADKKTKSKPNGNWWYRAIFSFLYDTGKYGISPLRVIISLLILVSVFTLIYFVLAAFRENAFSIGNTLNSNYNSPNGIMSELGTGFSFKKFWASLLYSVEGIIPFVSQFEAISAAVSVFTAIENAIGSFLVGYFSVAVIRKTLR